MKISIVGGETSVVLHEKDVRVLKEAAAILKALGGVGVPICGRVVNDELIHSSDMITVVVDGIQTVKELSESRKGKSKKADLPGQMKLPLDGGAEEGTEKP